MYSEGWNQLYDYGASCYAKRNYNEAETKLLAAIKELKHGLMEERKLVATRLLLADVYLATERIEAAEKLYNSCESMAKHTHGAESEEEAPCTDRAGHNPDVARALCRGPSALQTSAENSLDS